MMRIRIGPCCGATAAAGLAVLTACGGDLTLPEEPGGNGGTGAIAALGGNGQSGVVGEQLASPLAVRVSADGVPLAGQGVVFEVEAGGGSLAPDTTVSNSSGEATSLWTLGGEPGTQRALAKLVNGGSVVRFTAEAAVGAAAVLAMVSGDGQTGDPFVALEAPLVVAVTDRFGNPVEGVVVSWEVTGGRGELSDDEVTTDASGEAQVTWVLGFTLGTQSVRASVEGLEGSPVTFEASIF